MILSFMCVSLSFVHAAGMNKGQGKNMNLNMQQASFSEFDTNGDKQITKEEFNALRRERLQERTEEGRALKNMSQVSAFAAYDKNKDGVLSEEEFAAHQRYANPDNKNSNDNSGSSK